MKPSERELPLIQRGIIDNCFEEGQYEYGIDVLDKLRTQGYMPPGLHIRQLLYISLYPPPPPKRVDRTDVTLTPHKGQFQRQKQDLWPKPGSRPLAISLLNAFIRTNSPECLMRGLPYHSYVDNDGVKDVDPFGKDSTEISEDNSPLRDELLAMQSLKDCWGLLRDGFVKRKQFDQSHVGEEQSKTLENTIVGPYAWPILEWLIQVYEKDERREGEKEHAPYSALLLCQIPPPRSKTGPRWDVKSPLQVAFTCFSSISDASDHPDKYTSSKARWDLGSRLVSLLVNLTLSQSTLLSPSLFLSSVTTSLLDLPLESLHSFFSGIPTSQTLFKISMLDHYILTGNTDGRGSRKTGPTLPRAKPRFVGKGTSNVLFGIATTGTQDKRKDPYPMPSHDHLLTLISSPLPALSNKSGESSSRSLPLLSVKVALAKFHLVSSLCSLHLSHKLTDSQWDTYVRDGRLRQSVLDGFDIHEHTSIGHGLISDNDADPETDKQKIIGYMRSALEMIKVWETCRAY